METRLAFFCLALCVAAISYYPRATFEAQVKTRCDQKVLIPTRTICRSCSLNLRINCSEGYTKATTGVGIRDCRYYLEIRKQSLSLPGCRHICIKKFTQPLCCSGYWGPDCLDCPGGATSPCNKRGSCSDGLQGNGTCTCQEGFGGTACEICAEDHLFGANCNSVCNCVHGLCNNGINGDGTCTCLSGYAGRHCDQPLPECVKLQCPENARCTSSTGGSLVCACMPNYEGDGKQCKPINPCTKTICSSHADCTYLGPNKHKCTCHEGYEGDGLVCLPFDPCQENFGNCPTSSSICKYDGPGKYHCECKEGYDRYQPGIGCSLRDVCKVLNPCHKNANCTTVAPGRTQCTCKTSYVGDGLVCYGNILERIKDLNTEPGGKWKGKLTSAISLFGAAFFFPLRAMGPFTVLVPTNFGFKGINLQNILDNENNASYFAKLHIIAGLLNTDSFNNTNTIYTLTGKSGEVTNEEKDGLFKIRIHGSKKKSKIMEGNIIASNGLLHIVDKTIDNVEPTLESNTKKTIMEILEDNGRYNKFKSLLQKTTLGQDLNKDGPYSIFVPNNEAIDAMKDGVLDYLLSNQGSRKLLELLRHHIISSVKLDVAILNSLRSMQSMANQLIEFNTTNNGQILVSGVEIEETDVAAKNGQIFTLSGVLIPPSIVPILPHRCDETKSELILGSCGSCSLILFSACPPNSENTNLFSNKCNYMVIRFGAQIPYTGCAKFCNSTITVPKCCKGFYGPDCSPCPGGYSNPCSGNGECRDGMNGNGTCICDKGFYGSQCHFCSNPNKYGIRCDKTCACVHGTCANRIDGDGNCFPGSCKSGYAGILCDKKTVPCGPLVQYCHAHANCEYSDGVPSCICKPGYEGDGMTCEEVNVCSSSNNSFCNSNAKCIPTGPGTYNCVCLPGWAGNGLDCSAINNCFLPNNGGCHANATCIYIGPGQSDCECGKGFRGDGIQCEPINNCLEQEQRCHYMATCQLASFGLWKCVCQEGYEGDGTICYGNALNTLASLSETAAFYRLINDATISTMLSETKNITVLVPSRQAIESMDQEDKAFWMSKDNTPTLLKYHVLSGVYSLDLLQNMSSPSRLATALQNQYLHVVRQNGNVTLEGANILVANIAATNAIMHLVDKVLTPDRSMSPVQPDLLTRLGQIPNYSNFRGYIIQYSLANTIEAAESYTVFAPSNEAIETYIRNTKSVSLDEDVIRYHIVLGERLLKDNLHNGMHRETMLGFSYQVAFFINKDQLFVNEASINYTNLSTNKGVIHGLAGVLEIQRNRCDLNHTLVLQGECLDCWLTPVCPKETKLISNTRERCYRRFRRSYFGCRSLCAKDVITKQCCAGFFGQQCMACPGKNGDPCFGNGICLDGVNGTGICQCEEGYNGTACELCVKGKYGSKCDQECPCIHGKCSDGIEGDGSCECDVGWRGVKCDEEIKDDKCNKKCHTSANCIVNSGATAFCKCAVGFTGNGTQCTAIDACGTSNGGCSVNAKCRRTGPGNRICICNADYTGDGIVCLEINPCLENNGGCDINAECTQTGANKSECNCLRGYSGNGKICTSINPCLVKNGGCSWYAFCNHTGPEDRTCMCKSGYIGDGIECRSTISQELPKNPNTSMFHNYLQSSGIRDLSGSGPFTVFAPSNDAFDRESQISVWRLIGLMPQILRNHIVACNQLFINELTSMTTVTSLQGETIQITSSQDMVYLNNKTKIITSDLLHTNGIIHVVDKLLVPQKRQVIQKKLYFAYPKLDNLTDVADRNGYTIFSSLLQDTGLLSLISDPVHKPVTLFWPSDKTIKALPKERQDFLFNKQNKNKLVECLKFHVIRDAKILASEFPEKRSLKTLQGSDLSVKCGDNDNIGELLLNTDTEQCKIVQRQLEFEGGIAYGIDCLLTPPSTGGRCNSMHTITVEGLCGYCTLAPRCPPGSKPTGVTKSCSSYRYYSRLPKARCIQECSIVLWAEKCCSGYYGRECQACPGGPTTPCNNHGTCDEGYEGRGLCQCKDDFNGTACELCLPGKYGPDCKACECTTNGQCDEGSTGSGDCTCETGWTGRLCETKLDLPPVCSPACSENAICKKGNVCECKKRYEGDGITCTVVDLCKDNNGGCAVTSKCTQLGVKVTCTCQKGYKGDGYVCMAVDPCVDGQSGGCHEHAVCIMTGPGKRRCECKDHYIGDGVNCVVKELPIDRCLLENGLCHSDADCKDLHYQDTTIGVFHLRSPNGQYKLTYEEAKRACQDEGATLATYNQLAYSQKGGFHLCSAGWLDDKRVAYPTAYSSKNCGFGLVGIIDYGERGNVSEMWDVFCFRVKDVECTCKVGYVGDGYTCSGNMLQVLSSFPMFANFLSKMLAYADSSVKGKEFLNFLSNLSVEATLFAPKNDWLSENETLSGRDIEYHIANESMFFYNDLANESTLQTRIGNRLLITSSNDLDHKLFSSQNQQNESRFVNGRAILQWDIFASNGIIHVISEPLKAPLELPAALHAGHGAGIFFITILLVGLTALAGYLYKKYNKGQFRFQRFKPDEKISVSTLINRKTPSIVNPMYETSVSSPPESTFDQFSDADEQQPDISHPLELQ
ncbi:stabilin-2 [Microcaecilia unicolor]|uniref:Stabilin-2 n=1 Tax=Microcaecilia unicolor TaxID=1415580 RepID=A0A6P7YZA4_9AMPH|nr:stabilin-2 [Microcaecilia unicolor]